MASRDTPKVLIICGIATLTMLISITDTNEPRTTVPAMIHLPAGVVCAPVLCRIVCRASVMIRESWAGQQSPVLYVLAELM